MRVPRRGTSGAKRNSRRLSGTERAHRRWRSEYNNCSRRSMSASSRPSASMPLTSAGLRGRSMKFAQSRRLLRRHLLHFAGLEVEADAVDLVQVRAGHADEARVVGIIDRMDFPILIDAGMAR